MVTEIGKKDPTVKIDPERAVEQIFADLANGACKVIIEGRDSGQGVGIYDERGKINSELLQALVEEGARPQPHDHQKLPRPASTTTSW